MIACAAYTVTYRGEPDQKTVSRRGASLLVSGATLTTAGPLTSRFCGYQGSEEGDDAETLARIKINNNLGSAQKVVHNQRLDQSMNEDPNS
ncbi:hypothetical protein RB195_000544 [Necator americanus]|uniref:Uncharacterized protein n=1 Tax=Necator americanus TaxID=51031 RepID=A0ABR1DA95_NECAM